MSFRPQTILPQQLRSDQAMEFLLTEYAGLRETYDDLLGQYAETANWVLALFSFLAFTGLLVFGKTGLGLPFGKDQQKGLLRASVLAAVVLFIGLTAIGRAQTPGYDLAVIGMILTLVALVLWGLFALLRAWLVFTTEALVGPRLKGLWLKADARNKLKGKGLPEGARTPGSALELLSGNQNNLDAIWSPASRRASGTLLTLTVFFRTSLAMAGVALFAVGLGPSSPPVKVLSEKQLTLSAVAIFSHDSAELSEVGKKQLEQYLPQVLAQDPQKIVVVGHTDSTGEAAYTLTLSLQRAQAVKTWLTARPELEAVALEAFGKGEEEPLFNEAEVSVLKRTEARLGNRRVDVLIDPADG